MILGVKVMRSFSCAMMVGLTITIAGCASANKTIDAAGVTSLQNQKLVVTTGDRPKFVAKTPASSFLATQGVVGFLAVHMMSDDIAVKHGIEDPAIAISNKLQTRLKGNHKMQVVKKAESAQFELKVMSTAFGAGNKPFSTTEYVVDYNANAQLRDIRSNKLIAEASCHIKKNTPTDEKLPNYDELFANNAARLKAELNRKVERCTQTIMHQIFGKNTQAQAAG